MRRDVSEQSAPRYSREMGAEIPPEVAREIAKIGNDESSGAAEILERALSVFDAIGNRDFSIYAVCEALAAAQPEMAPLANLARTVQESASTSKEARIVARRFVEEAKTARERSIENAARLMKAHSAVLTHSRSSTVRSALVRRAALGPFEVVATESMPLGEGRILTRELCSMGITARCISDEAVEREIDRCGAFFCGADEISSAGVVNKAGTSEIALLASKVGIPSYTVADWTKLVAEPPDTPRTTSIFDITPLDRFAAIVTEAGALSPAELRETLMGLRNRRRASSS